MKIVITDRIKEIIKNQGYFLVFVLFSLILIFSLVTYYFMTEPGFSWSEALNLKDQSKTYRLIDGRKVDDDFSKLRPVAVMMENHIDSRPPAGLEYASIVYEAIVEGDITRFLVIFDPKVPAEKIGPVRSARPFFVEIAKEWNPVYFHAGGSPEALADLKTSSIPNINEISADGIYFWRDSKREAPHNLFTSINLINRVITAKEISQIADFSPWLFKIGSATKESAPEFYSKVEVNFSNNSYYDVVYKYDINYNNYTRYLAGNIHKTDRGIILKADNIIVQHVDYDIIDDYGRLNIDLQTGGPAEVYQDGREIKGFWAKNNNRTRFFSNDGQEIKFNPGVTWVELVFY